MADSPALCPVAETYEDVRSILNNVANKIKKMYGGDLDDIRSECNLSFMRCYRKHEPTKGSFYSRVNFKVRCDLIDTRRKEYRHRLPLDPLAELSTIPARREFNLEQLIEDLSGDAEQVIMLVLQPPEVVNSRNPRKKAIPTKRSIVQYLEDIGWAAERIAESFREIQEILTI